MRFWVELTDLKGFSESSGEMGTTGIIPVLVPGSTHGHLRMSA
jgi:hypothetical protein